MYANLKRIYDDTNFQKNLTYSPNITNMTKY